MKTEACGTKCVLDWLIRPTNDRNEGNEPAQGPGYNRTEPTVVYSCADILRLTEVVNGAMIDMVMMICEHIGV